MQIFINGQWGLIAGTVTDNALNVFCQQLFGVDNYDEDYYDSFWVYHQAPIIADTFMCDGTEQRLIDCTYDYVTTQIEPTDSVWLICDVDGT